MPAEVRVLLVDDDARIRFLLRSQLESDERFVVVGEGENGRDALDLRATEQPDLILLDLSMPVMDGLEAIPLIREVDPRVKIAVLSGFSAGEMETQVLSLGADVFLEKTESIFIIVDRIYAIARSDALPHPIRSTDTLESGSGDSARVMPLRYQDVGGREKS